MVARCDALGSSGSGDLTIRSVFDLESAAVFLEVAKRGSFSGSSEKTNMTKSMIKRRIDALEDSVGVPLLRRSTRGIELTAAGKVFERRASDIIHSVDLLIADCQRAASGDDRRVIKVAYYTDFVFPIVQYVCDHYSERFPNDIVEPIFIKFSDAFEATRSGEVDVAICTQPPLSQAFGIQSTLLYATRMVGMVSRTNFENKKVLTREDLADSEVVVHPMWCAREDLDAWQNSGSVRFEVATDSGPAATAQIVCTRGGVYLYPETDSMLYPYRYLPLEDPIYSRSVVVCPVNHSEAVRDFVNIVVRYTQPHIDPTDGRLLIDWSKRPDS